MVDEAFVKELKGLMEAGADAADPAGSKQQPGISPMVKELPSPLALRSALPKLLAHLW